jgi:hypothetical protein
MVTGQGNERLAVTALKQGARDYIVKDTLTAAALNRVLAHAIEQHRLERAENDLLEQTLRGSIRALTEVLSLVNPMVFGRALRITRYVRHMAARLGRRDAWVFEVAAMLSQLGCVSLPTEIVMAFYSGAKLTHDAKEQFEKHPTVARDILARIPRLEPVVQIIERQNDDLAEGSTTTAPETRETVTLGAQLLKLAIEFDVCHEQGLTHVEAVAKLEKRHRIRQAAAIPLLYAPDLLVTLTNLETDDGALEARAVAVDQLSPGMVLDEDIRTSSGALLATCGQDVTVALLARVQNLARSGTVAGVIRVLAESPRQLRNTA